METNLIATPETPPTNTMQFTTFADVLGRTLTKREMTWTEIADMLYDAKIHAAKLACPLLKLATFGEKRTAKGSLRSDENMLAITGVEGDHDAGTCSIAEAKERLEAHGVKALLYTSYSSRNEAPRWRVLCPTSTPLAPAERERLVSRLNGALRGVLARESWALSQAYFFGRGESPGYECACAFDDPEEGFFIDELHALDEIAVGPPGASAPANGQATAGAGSHEDWLADLLDGEDVHGNSLRTVARMVARGLDDATIQAVFEALFDAIAKERGPDRAAALVHAGELDRMIAGARKKGFAPVDPKEAMAAIAARIDGSADTDVPEIVDEIAKARLSNSMQDALFQRIKKKHGIRLNALRLDTMNAQAKHARAMRGGKQAAKDKDQLDFCADLIDALGEGNVVYAQGHFWRWSATGVWRRAVDREIMQVAQDVLDADEAPVSKSLIDGVIDVTKSKLFQREAPFDQADWRLVNVANGTLEWDGADWHLREHRKDDFLTTQLPVAYDPAAACPRVEQFLREVFAGDADAADKSTCLMEMTGYSLLTTCRFERFVILIGGGANGKSVQLGMLEALLGRSAVAAVQPSQFDNKFQRAHLHGKLANIVSELREGAEIPDGELKAIVSGELMTVEHKNQAPFDLRPFATCWFGTNHLPHTRDFSEAMFRRAIVLRFNNKFEGAARDPHLRERLVAELPGVLAMALRALAGVLRRGDFTIPASSIEATRQWRRDVDQVAQFVDERCHVHPGGVITSTDLYQAYKVWAADAGIRQTLGRNAFTRRVVQAGGEKGKTGKEGTRSICGLALRDGAGGGGWPRAA